MRRLAIIAALAVFTAGPVAGADTGIDVHAEVAAALYSASATQAAADRLADERLRADRAAIASLTAKVKAGEAKRAQLVTAEQDFVAQLAQKDRAYSEIIGQLRGSVQAIAETPAGAQALARFNSGDVAGGLAAMDAIQGADEAARRKVAELEDAAGERHIADLAADAELRGEVGRDEVIKRYEAVTRRDPTVFNDWSELSYLYDMTGRWADERRAAQTGLKLADSDLDRERMLDDLAHATKQLGDIPGARAAVEDSVVIERRQAAAGDRYALPVVVGLLDQAAVLAEAQGDAKTSSQDREQALSLAMQLVAASPDDSLISGALDGALIGAVDLSAPSALPASRAAFAKALALRRRLAQAAPSSVGRQVDLAFMLATYGEVLSPMGDCAGAAVALTESGSILGRLASAGALAPDVASNVASKLHDLIDDLEGCNDTKDAHALSMGAAAFVRVNWPTADRVGQQEMPLLLEEIAGALQAHDDPDGAGRTYQAALDLRRRLAAADPSSAAKQTDVTRELDRLAYIGAQGVTWAEVTASIVDLRRRGLLDAAGSSDLIADVDRYAPANSN